MASSEPSSSEYVGHHLLHLNNIGEMQTKLFDINFINIDTVFWGLFTGLLTIFLLWSRPHNLNLVNPQSKTI